MLFNIYCVKWSLAWFICFVTIAFVADPSTALWFWAVDRHWDQVGRSGVDVGTITVGDRGQGEETQRGGSRKGAQGRGGVLLRTRRRGRGSLSMPSKQRQRWRRIPMPRGRESGLVALSSLHNLIVLWYIHEQCCLILDFALCCHIMHFKYGRT